MSLSRFILLESGRWDEPFRYMFGYRIVNRSDSNRDWWIIYC